MPFAIRFHQTGGPEVLRWEEVAVGDPAPSEARVRHQAVGLNYIDTYHRSGLYPLPLPSGLGTEGAGIVEAVGAGVTDLQIGDRVAVDDDLRRPAGALVPHVGGQAHVAEVEGNAEKVPRSCEDWCIAALTGRDR